MARWLSTSAALSILCVLAPGGEPAVAQKGVHVDPDSPAGKQYALPLDAARRAAAGDDHSVGAGGGSAPVFGVGISEKDGSGGAGSSGTDGGAARTGGSPSQESESGDESSGASGIGSTPAAGAVADTGGVAPRLLVALLALGVLSVGAIAGLAVRALGRSHPSR